MEGCGRIRKSVIDRDKALSVVIELAAGVAGNEQMAWTIANAIHQELLRLNSEFANYRSTYWRVGSDEPSGQPRSPDRVCAP